MENYIYHKNTTIPLYRGLFVPVCTNSIELLQKFVPTFDDSQVFAHTIYADRDGTEGYHLILNFHDPKHRITHGVIAHEALHVIDMIAEMRGFVPTHINDEYMAYLIEWVIDEMYKFINLHKLEVYARA